MIAKAFTVLNTTAFNLGRFTTSYSAWEKLRAAAEAPRYLINKQVQYSGKAKVLDWNSRVIGSATEKAAKKLASLRGLDLVLIAEEPVTVQLMDYTKYLYKEATKKHREEVRKETNQPTRKMLLSYNISLHDLDVKLNKAWKLVERGAEVQLEIKSPEHLDEEVAERNLIKAMMITQRYQSLAPNHTATKHHSDGPIHIRLRKDPDPIAKHLLKEVVANTDLAEAIGVVRLQQQMRSKLKEPQEADGTLKDERLSTTEQVLLRDLELMEEELPEVVEDSGESELFLKRLQSKREKLTEELQYKSPFNIKKGITRF